jgi:hypothetical protein
VEPSRLYQSRQFLGDLVRQIDIYGFHSNSILRDQSVSVYALRVSPAGEISQAPSGDLAVCTDPMVTWRYE